MWKTLHVYILAKMLGIVVQIMCPSYEYILDINIYMYMSYDINQPFERVKRHCTFSEIYEIHIREYAFLSNPAPTLPTG